MGSLHLAVEPWGAGFDADVVDAEVEQMPVEDWPNSEPLSVWTRSTWKGSLAMTSSMKAIAVFWSQRG